MSSTLAGSKGILPFLAVSLLAHSWLLGQHIDAEPVPLQQGSQALRLAIVAGHHDSPAVTVPPPAAAQREETAPPALPKPTPAHRPPPARAVTPAHPERPRQPSTQPPVSAAAPTPGESAPAAPRHADIDRVRGSIRNSLARYFSYPRRARQRGWQGEVRLSIHVQADGALSRVRVAQSSGIPLLDRAAVDSARRVRHIPDAAMLLRGQALDLVIPVRYELRDS